MLDVADGDGGGPEDVVQVYASPPEGSPAYLPRRQLVGLARVRAGIAQEVKVDVEWGRMVRLMGLDRAAEGQVRLWVGDALRAESTGTVKISMPMVGKGLADYPRLEPPLGDEKGAWERHVDM